MLKKFPCLGDSSNSLATRPNTCKDHPEEYSTHFSECSKPSDSPPGRYSRPKTSITLSRTQNPSCSRSQCYQTPPANLWKRFKRWLRGLCICGRRRSSCKKTFTAWRSFRKDWAGSVPVAMETLDGASFNYFERLPPSQYQLADDSLVPPPPYDFHTEQLHSIHNGSERFYEDARIGSLETGGTNQNDFDGTRSNPWCKILYWEGRERKGSVYPVLPPAINVLGDTPHGSGLSLAAFFGGPNTDERIMRTRRKICQGLVLWRDGEVVWVYNRSEAPVYLNSASLDGSFYHLNLYKCPPGYAMIIYYYEMARHLMGLPEYKDRCMDKADVNSVRISFAKGWGKNYHRREILCCPCWIEVHVVPTLRVEQLTPPR